MTAPIPWREHGPALLQLALPIVFTAIIQQLGTFVTLSFVGRIDGAEYMGAVALGGMLCNVTGYSLFYGMTSALDALISQAYGAREYQLMGLHTQRAIVILSLFSIPVAFLWYQTEYLLINVLGIAPEVSKLAGQWSIILIGGMWPNLIFEILRKFLQGQNIVWPSLAASVLRTVSVFVFSYASNACSYGFRGLGLASIASNWVCLISIIVFISARRIYVLGWGRTEHVMYAPVSLSDEDLASGAPLNTAKESVSNPELNWPSLGMEIFQDWGTFFQLGVPGAASLFLEWGSFELAASVAGHIQPNAVLAAHGVYMNTCGMLYMLPLGVASATATIGGNLLGAGDAPGAWGVIKMGVVFDFSYGVVAGLTLFQMKSMWGSLYTSDSDIQQLVAGSMIALAIYEVVDSTKCITLNVLRSIGLPAITVAVNCVCCVLILLPVGWTLGVTLGYGLAGLWTAMSLAWLTATFIFSYVVLTTDWQQQVEEAKRRNTATQNGISEGCVSGQNDKGKIAPLVEMVASVINNIA